MAFPYVLLANFRASQLQRQAMTPFLRGQIWLTSVEPGGFLGDLLLKKLRKTQKAISQALLFVTIWRYIIARKRKENAALRSVPVCNNRPTMVWTVQLSGVQVKKWPLKW
jgi:hypothetical protein